MKTSYRGDKISRMEGNKNKTKVKIAVLSGIFTYWEIKDTFYLFVFQCTLNSELVKLDV